MRFLLQVLHLSRCPKASLLDCKSFFSSALLEAANGGWSKYLCLFLRVSRKWGVREF